MGKINEVPSISGSFKLGINWTMTNFHHRFAIDNFYTNCNLLELNKEVDSCKCTLYKNDEPFYTQNFGFFQTNNIQWKRVERIGYGKYRSKIEAYNNGELCGAYESDIIDYNLTTSFPSEDNDLSDDKWNADGEEKIIINKETTGVDSWIQNYKTELNISTRVEIEGDLKTDGTIVLKSPEAYFQVKGNFTYIEDNVSCKLRRYKLVINKEEPNTTIFTVEPVNTQRKSGEYIKPDFDYPTATAKLVDGKYLFEVVSHYEDPQNNVVDYDLDFDTMVFYNIKDKTFQFTMDDVDTEELYRAHCTYHYKVENGDVYKHTYIGYVEFI